jgi:hypothetical protein
MEQRHPGAESSHPDHSIAASVESQLQAIVLEYHIVLQKGAYERTVLDESCTIHPPPSDVVQDERWLRKKVRRDGERVKILR